MSISISNTTDNLSVEIVSVSDLNCDEWNEFLLTTSEATFFCTTDWWRSFENSFVLQIKDQDRRIIAGIPFRILSVVPLLGSFFKFCMLDSSAIVSQVYNKSDVYSLKKMVLDSLIKHLGHRVIVLLISSKARSKDADLFRDMRFNVEKSATLIIDLTKEENEIFRLFSKGNKSSIRKAQKLGVQIKIFEGDSSLNYITDFCMLQESLFQYKEGSYSKIYSKSEDEIRKILTSVANKSYLAIAYFNEKPAAGALLLSYNNTIYYYLGASDHILTRTSQASNLLHYEIIKYAQIRRFSRYDLGGIPYSSDANDNIYGVYLFKKSFGGERTEYDHGNLIISKHRYWLIWKLRKYENQPVLRFIYTLLKK
jgi:lipid II:glycine glycyltransferase (peptidoglycan interpeptide bridge formation enzyme)